eukprot:8270399-Lingulodinium_polyedra.AAC.1
MGLLCIVASTASASVGSLVGIYSGLQWVRLTSTGGYVVEGTTGSMVDSILGSVRIYIGVYSGVQR